MPTQYYDIQPISVNYPTKKKRKYHPYVDPSIGNRGFKSPADLPGLKIWIEVNLSVTGLLDNDPITTANDLSGNANHFTQSVGANKPAFRTNILNGLPAAEFTHIIAADGHWMVSPYAASDNNDPNQTFAAVFKTNNPADGEIMLWQGNTNGNGFGTEPEISLSLGNGGAGNTISSSYGGASQAPVADFSPFNDSNFHIGIATFNQLTNDGATKTTTIKVDNNAKVSASGTTDNNLASYTGTTFWGKPDAAGTITRVWNGLMAAVVVCNTVLSDADQLNLYNYWKTKYGL